MLIPMQSAVRVLFRITSGTEVLTWHHTNRHATVSEPTLSQSDSLAFTF